MDYFEIAKDITRQHIRNLGVNMMRVEKEYRKWEEEHGERFGTLRQSYRAGFKKALELAAEIADSEAGMNHIFGPAEAIRKLGK